MPLNSPNARRETLVRAEERDNLLVSSSELHAAKAPTYTSNPFEMSGLQH